MDCDSKKERIIPPPEVFWRDVGKVPAFHFKAVGLRNWEDFRYVVWLEAKEKASIRQSVKKPLVAKRVVGNEKAFHWQKAVFSWIFRSFDAFCRAGNH